MWVQGAGYKQLGGGWGRGCRVQGAGYSLSAITASCRHLAARCEEGISTCPGIKCERRAAARAQGEGLGHMHPPDAAGCERCVVGVDGEEDRAGSG